MRPCARTASRRGAAPLRSEFSDEEWRLVSELADYPNRLLVTVTTESGETYAEVAHEAIFRRWDKLREWIAAEREFLAWRSGLEAARRAWQATPDSSKNDALLMGYALAQAQSWLAKRAEDLPGADREFIVQSVERESKARARARRVQALVYVCGRHHRRLVGVDQSGLGQGADELVLNDAALTRWRICGPTCSQPEAERALKPRGCFQGMRQDCPEMIVVPAGSS